MVSELRSELQRKENEIEQQKASIQELKEVLKHTSKLFRRKDYTCTQEKIYDSENKLKCLEDEKESLQKQIGEISINPRKYISLSEEEYGSIERDNVECDGTEGNSANIILLRHKAFDYYKERAFANAFLTFLELADAMDVYGFWGIGHMFRNGDGVMYSKERAYRYSLVAADKGFVPAMLEVGGYFHSEREYDLCQFHTRKIAVIKAV